MTPWILVAEDELDIRELIAEVLREDGFVVDTATDGVAALGLIRQRPDPPYLIFLDLMMPGMNGWDFLVERRKEPRIAKVPVVILSADPLRAAAYGREVLAVLAKPFNVATLLQMARAVYRVRQRQGA